MFSSSTLQDEKREILKKLKKILKQQLKIIVRSRKYVNQQYNYRKVHNNYLDFEVFFTKFSKGRS